MSMSKKRADEIIKLARKLVKPATNYHGDRLEVHFQESRTDGWVNRLVVNFTCIRYNGVGSNTQRSSSIFTEFYTIDIIRQRLLNELARVTIESGQAT